VRVRPEIILDAKGHCWRHSDAGVPLAEVVGREVQGDGSFKVFHFLLNGETKVDRLKMLMNGRSLSRADCRR
jgi:hypothetical protein